jgi:hypothetical protein
LRERGEKERDAAAAGAASSAWRKGTTTQQHHLYNKLLALSAPLFVAVIASSGGIVSHCIFIVNGDMES